MQAREIQVEERKEQGSGAVRRLRKAGSIPAVVYSESFPATSIVLDDHGYQLAVRGAGSTQLFKFNSSHSVLNGLTTLIKDVQVEPIKGKILHVDFIALSAGHMVSVTVPVELTGECLAVKEMRAFLNQSEYQIDVECLPDAIPNKLTIDISSLIEGGSLHASDIVLPTGVKLRSIKGLTIVSAISKKAADAEAAAQEAATAASQPAKAAAAAAAPAAKPAAGAKPAAKK